MNESHPSNRLAAQWQKSTTRRFIHWFVVWRNLRKILFVLVGMVTLVALFCAEENWRGSRAWQQYAKQLEARGEPVHLEEIIPAPVPDAENFAATPFWSNLRYRSSNKEDSNTNRWPIFLNEALNKGRIRKKTLHKDPSRELFKMVDLPVLAEAIARIKGDSQNQEPIELPAITNSQARVQAAEMILKELQAYDSVIEELRDASSRPRSRFPIAYDTPNPWSILLPHLAKVRGVCQALRVKASVALALGHPDQALADVRLILKITDSLQSEPFLITFLVRMACLHIASSVVWEGQVFHAWQESHLRDLQQQFASFDFISDAQAALRGERTWANTFFDILISRNNRPELAREIDSAFGDGSGAVLLRLVPRGWIYFEKLHYNQFFDKMTPNLVDLRKTENGTLPSILQEQTDRTLEAIEAGSPFRQIWDHRIFSKLLLPALGKVYQRAARGQAVTEITTLACALERHYLKHDSYPENLSALVPEFIAELPMDVASDQPYRYEPQPNKLFLLYSVGWNETDDGGTDPAKDGDGDWVWRFP